MKAKNVVVGMEVKLRKNIDQCTFTNGCGKSVNDGDLYHYNGGDIVEVLSAPDSDGDVKVGKGNITYVWVNVKHLRKI